MPQRAVKDPKTVNCCRAFVVTAVAVLMIIIETELKILVDGVANQWDKLLGKGFENRCIVAATQEMDTDCSPSPHLSVQ